MGSFHSPFKGLCRDSIRVYGLGPIGFMFKAQG